VTKGAFLHRKKGFEIKGKLNEIGGILNGLEMDFSDQKKVQVHRKGLLEIGGGFLRLWKKF